MQALPIDDQHASDPATITEAKKGKYWAHWLAAIHEELAALEAKCVYEEIESIPDGRRPVDSKWVLHIKRNSEGLISRFKARLVARGFTQIPGQDFSHTFAPVARWDSIRTILAISAARDRELRHIDIKTAFLNGPLQEEIYMRKPDVLGRGYWKLLKGLYGLKQAGRTWYIEFNKTLNGLGFARCESDWSTHHKGSINNGSFSATSVDDILLSSTSPTESNAVTAGLKQSFELTDNGDVEWLLGCKITRNRGRRSLLISQETYTESILRTFGMENCNAATTPLPPGVQLTKAQTPLTTEAKRELDKLPYATLVGKAMYLATSTRPDIAYAVRELARFMADYREPHWAAAKHLLRYLQGTRSLGLLLGHQDPPFPLIRAISDSDWASGDSRRSISGYVVMIGASPVGWSSKQQNVVALSSCEAEYLACSHVAKEVMWLRNLLEELGFGQHDATEVYCDNNGAIASSHDPHGHTRMKHIDIRAHFIRDCVNKGYINVVRVDGKENAADILTKGLSKILQEKGIKLLGLHRGQGGVLSGDLGDPKEGG